MAFDALSGPNFIVPTPPSGDSSNRVADTAFVGSSIINGVIASTGLGESTTATSISLFINLPHTTASLGSDVSMNNLTTYFDGPSVAQGSTGTWLAMGTITCNSTSASADAINVKLWDGSTVFASAAFHLTAGGGSMSLSLSGYITSPTGNIRISANDPSSVGGKILFNNSGNSKDSTITAIRIA